jgi:tetratricopeptide (TPR) repeat protein
MKKMLAISSLCIHTMFFISCKDNRNGVTTQKENEISLKRGAVISCSPGEENLGILSFKIDAPKAIQDEFNTGIKLLHSFEYDEAEKVFASIIEKDPSCGMAWWGVAMSNFHALWTPPTGDELKKGSWAIEKAKLLSKEPKETAYIDAVSVFFNDWEKTDHRTRTIRFEQAMQQLHENFPNDPEAAIFYALALDAAADPADKTYSRQKKAGELLQKLQSKFPDHPGIIHYIIHSYDAPELASQALPAARKYAAIAPSSSHALHMPSHIFTRLGLWKECIVSNKQAVSSAKCYAESAGMKGHWDEELHATDYLVYGYLQLGEKDSAKKLVEYLSSMEKVTPVNFKVAYAFAAAPSRYIIENKLWKEAAQLRSNPSFISWNEYPWQHAIIIFTRALGNIHTGELVRAKKEIDALKTIHKTLLSQTDNYKANQVLIQVHCAEAWQKFKEGKNSEALEQMNLATSLEDNTEKHPVTPCEVIPARELLADMLLEMQQPEKAIEAYNMDLAKHPNRRNAIAGKRKALQLLASSTPGKK